MNFNEKVWALTKKIPKGKVSTYKQIAKALHTKAYRAVGTALKKNPYGAWGRAGGKSYQRQRDLVPCHRVINSNGTIGGFKGKKNSKEKTLLLKKEGIEIKNNKTDLKKYLFLLFLFLFNLFL